MISLLVVLLGSINSFAQSPSPPNFEVSYRYQAPTANPVPQMPVFQPPQPSLQERIDFGNYREKLLWHGDQMRPHMDKAEEYLSSKNVYLAKEEFQKWKYEFEQFVLYRDQMFEKEGARSFKVQELDYNVEFSEGLISKFESRLVEAEAALLATRASPKAIETYVTPQNPCNGCLDSECMRRFALQKAKEDAPKLYSCQCITPGCAQRFESQLAKRIERLQNRSHELKKSFHEVRDALSLRTHYIKERDYIKNSLDRIEQVAKENPSSPLFVDFAIDSARAFNAFIKGVGEGLYDGFASPIKIAEIVYSNPELLNHLSTNILNSIADPKLLWSNVKESIQRVSEQLYQFEVVMAYGSSEEKGHAFGQLGADLLLAAAGAKLALPYTEALGSTLQQQMRTLSHFRRELSLVEQRVKNTYNPLNPGPLDTMPATRLPVANGGPSMASTFRSGTYEMRTTEAPRKFYRVQRYSYDDRRPLSKFWNDTKPQGPTQAIIDNVIASNFGIGNGDVLRNNNAIHWIEIEVPSGITYFEGFPAPQGEMMGSGAKTQIVFENVPNEWVKDHGKF